MRKLVLILSIVILLAACGSTTPPADDRTIDHFFEAFEASFTLDDIFGDGEPTVDTPFYGMIGAVDGILFYVGGSPISIYRYADVAALERAQSNFDFTADWPTNGRFLLEANNQDVIAFFENIA